MRISTRGRYALRMMLDLAQHEKENGYVALKEIAERQSISKKYLEQMAARMHKNGLVLVNRGQQGGYKLGKPASQITLWEVLSVTEESVALVSCMDETPNACERSSFCLTLPVWMELNGLIRNYLSTVTLADVLSGSIPKAGNLMQSHPEKVKE